DHPLGFTVQEALLIERLGPHIAHALRQSLLLNGSADQGWSRAPGVLVLTDDLSVVAVTGEAEHLLSLIDAHGPSVWELPVVVRAAVAALKAIESGTAATGVQPTTRVRT